ncbi:MAG: rod shape-determining protein MreC [Oscillospiraceae bacterium]|nr:rod shape-determining protein MreC [Oscillospiraceae bacterium]
MKDFFHSIKFKILLGIGALLLGLMTYVAIAAGRETTPQQVLNTITYPFVKAANFVADGVGGFFDKLINADKYKSQNDELLAELTEMYKYTMDYDSLEQENARLREMLGLKEKNADFRFSEPCDVNSRNANDLYGGFTINKGKSDGLSLNDPVITSVGLVGRVSSIGENYSRVTTLISPEVNVGVYTMRTKTTGVIENDVSSAQKGLCLMSDILKEADIKAGDIIFTSGKSGLMPADIMVGTVTEVYDDPNGLTKHALVKPAEDVKSVSSVFAITDFNGKGIPFKIDE